MLKEDKIVDHEAIRLICSVISGVVSIRKERGTVYIDIFEHDDSGPHIVSVESKIDPWPNEPQGVWE